MNIVPVNGQASMLPCQIIVDEIDNLKDRVKNLQIKLQSAPSNQKADIVDQIDALNEQIYYKEIQLNDCNYKS